MSSGWTIDEVGIASMIGPVGMVSSDLEAARSALEEGQPEDALVALIDAWCATGSPEIADVVDNLSNELSLREEPVRATSGTSAKKAWMAVAAADRPASLGRLLEVLPDGLDRTERLAKIAALGRDPRITPFARAWITDPPVQGPRRVPFFTKLIELLSKTRDVRLVPWLEEITASSARSSTIGNVGLKSWRPLVELTKTLAKAKVKALDARDESTLFAIRSRLGAAQGSATPTASADPASLFAKVFEDPEDDEARAVLGDLLQQKGDPRGEFIALQLARHGSDKPRSARERSLEATWGRDWLGAIEPVVLKGDVVFERGFVTRCRYGGTADTKVLLAEEWSTVTHLDATNASKYVAGSHELLRQDHAHRSMRHVIGLATDDITKLAGAVALPWETLGMRVWDWDRAAPLLQGPGETFARVRKLVILQTESHALRASTTAVMKLLERWPALEHLEIALSHAQVAELARKSKDRPSLQRLTVRSPEGLTYDIERTTNHLELTFEMLRPDAMQSATQTVKALDRRSGLERVSLVVHGRIALEGNTLVRGRHDRMSVAPLQAAAKAAALGFDVALSPALGDPRRGTATPR